MKRPNPIIYAILGFIVKFFALLKGQKIQRIDKIKGPCIILSNHTSFYDFIYTTAAVYPNRVNYMAASKMFYDPFLGFFLRLARAFPKSLFQSDPVSTLNAFRVLRINGIVSIFPEGQISPIGVTQVFNLAIAKLLIKAKVDVYVVLHRGAYLVNPPWSKKSFRGKIETTIEKIATKEQISAMTEADLNLLIAEKLSFNSHEYNETRKMKVHLKQITNLEAVLYRCPTCGAEELYTSKYALHCPNCKSVFEYDRFGKVGGLQIDDLYHAQEQIIQSQINQNPDYKLSSRVKLESFRNERLVIVGEGQLELTVHGYRFEGVVDQQMTIYEFTPKNIPTLPSDIGRNIQIYDGYMIYQFVFEDVHIPTKFVIAGEYIHQLYLKNQ